MLYMYIYIYIRKTRNNVLFFVVLELVLPFICLLFFIFCFVSCRFNKIQYFTQNNTGYLFFYSLWLFMLFICVKSNTK